MFKQRQGLRMQIVFYLMINLSLFGQVSLCKADLTKQRSLTALTEQTSQNPTQTSTTQIEKPKLEVKPQQSKILNDTNAFKLGYSSPRPPPSYLRKSASTLLSLSTGLIVSGGGHYLIDQPKIASRLFWWKLGGTVGILGGATALASTGASNLVTPWAIPTLLVSGANFVLPTIFDLLGIWLVQTVKPKDSIELPPLSIAPLLQGFGSKHIQLALGSRQTILASPHTYYGLTWSQSLSKFAYQLSTAWANQQARFHLNTQYSLSHGQGWRLWQSLGLTSHHQRQAQVRHYQGELTFRLALRFGQIIHNKFKQFSGEIFTGWYGGAIEYPKGSLDQTTGVLGGFALVHHSFKDHLRFQINYNHRHDDWVGGAVVPGLGSGILGYIQSSLSLRLNSKYWLKTQASFGSAHLYTIHLLWAG